MVEGQSFYYVLLWVTVFAVWFLFLRWMVAAKHRPC